MDQSPIIVIVSSRAEGNGTRNGNIGNFSYICNVYFSSKPKKRTGEKIKGGISI